MNIAIVSRARVGVFGEAGMPDLAEALKKMRVQNRKLVIFNLDNTMNYVSDIHNLNHELREIEAKARARPEYS